MVVLIDTNVILDVLLKRLPYYEKSLRVWELSLKHQIKGVLAAHGITNLWYILRKEFNDFDRRKLVSALFDTFEISSLTKDKLISAINRSDFKDFEDCLQDECAIHAKADCIVTRNVKDFVNAKTPVLTPEEFVKKYS